jgi:hypothetical protein
MAGETLTDPGLSGKELHDLLSNAEYDAHPSWRHLTTTHWVMSLEWYKAIRRAFLPPGLPPDDEARDESKWEPQHGDMVLAYHITVTKDGGAPHLADGRPAKLRALIRRHDPNMAGG